MARLKDGEAVAVAEAEDPAQEQPEAPNIICGVDVSKLIAYTTEAELPSPTYRTKTDKKGRKYDVLVAKGEPRYYTQASGQELVEVRRGFHKIERRWFCRIRTKDPNWKPFIEEIRRRGIREVY